MKIIKVNNGINNKLGNRPNKTRTKPVVEMSEKRLDVADLFIIAQQKKKEAKKHRRAKRKRILKEKQKMKELNKQAQPKPIKVKPTKKQRKEPDNEFLFKFFTEGL